jgi:stearoyl-CoA desaturase (delta-9 desaturase)
LLSELTPFAVPKSESEPLSRREPLVNLAAVTVPFLGLVAAVVCLWGRGFSWVELGLLVGMHTLTGLGITVGFHRLFTHCGFETSKAVEFVLAVLGSMAVQGPLLKWVAMHRLHHQHSDTHGDPHSPHHRGPGARGLLRGLWHAHLGWLFEADPPGLSRYARDLRRDGPARVASALFPVWALAGLLLPAALAAC